MSEELRKTLETVRDAIVNADPNVLTCTLWMPSGTETVVDYIDARLARVSPSQAGHEGLVTLPRTSTPEMNIAGGIAIQAARASAETPVDLAHACYEAMKGAAPSFLSQAGEPVAVAVKPLEWVETPYGAYAETAFGTAEACTDGLWTFAGMGTHEAGDISDAQASVQDAYEALIRSYLVSAPPAAPAAEAMREACAKVAEAHNMPPDRCNYLSYMDPETGLYECPLEARGRDCICNERLEVVEQISAAIRALPLPTPPTAPADDTPKCFACAQPFKLGEMVIEDINEGTMHAACCGQDRDAYVHLDDGSPLAEGEPIPAGDPWFPDTPETRLAFKLGKKSAAAPAAEVDAVHVPKQAWSVVVAALHRISDWCPATQEFTLAHSMAAEADEAIAALAAAGITDTSQKEG